MNKRFKPLAVKELREEFPRVREALGRGSQFVLIYRSKPIAELTPIRAGQEAVSKALHFFAHPPKAYQIRSRLSAAELIRREREE